MLPVAVPLLTSVELVPRADSTVRVESDGRSVATFPLGDETRTRTWGDYVRGVVWAVGRAGHPLRGFDARIRSTIPSGAGLASSAALCVAFVRALREAFALAIDDLTVARLAHEAESGYVGVRSGVMDQLAASLGEERVALFIDTRSLAIERVPLPDAIDLAAVHSGIRHAHAGGAYNALRAELEDAARRLGYPSLRDVPDERALEPLAEPTRARARHVVRENARVLAAVAALRAGDVPRLAALLADGHASLRDDLGVSVPEVDLLVEIAAADPDAYGARITGGGFGGSVVILTRRGTAREVAARVARAYAQRTGRPGRAVLP